MKAIAVHANGNAVALRWEEAADPVPGPGDVLLEVFATAVNRADLLQARGLYPPPMGDSPVLGMEAAGKIQMVGEDVPDWRVGDRVCALLPGGGYAEKAVVAHEMLMPLPDSWDYTKGAAVPEVWLTAYTNLVLEGNLQAGETVLIHAGASGVGTAAIQIARELGARVLATAGSEQKRARCRELGAVGAIDYRSAALAEAVTALTDHAGVDLILDCIGGPHLAAHLAMLKPYGRLITIGVMGGSRGTLDLATVLMKSLTLKGTRLRATSREGKARLNRLFLAQIWPGLLAGRFVPVVDRVFPISAAGDAHQYVKENRNIGKVILEIRSGGG